MAESAYPIQYEADVVLRDGSTLRLRPIWRGDEGALRELHERLSAESWRSRFFNTRGSVLPDLSSLTRMENGDQFVLVAEARGRLSGLATCSRYPHSRERAEVAFTIADALQGRGVGTRMLEALALSARAQGIRTFDAYVLPDNDRMMRVFLDSRFEVDRRVEGGVVHVELSLEPTAQFEMKAAARSQVAASASMKGFFEPRAVAVVGGTAQLEGVDSLAPNLHRLESGGFSWQMR